MDEKIIFKQRGVTVTPTRFVVYGTTYPINGISSVRVLIEKPSKKWPILLICAGVLFFLFSQFALGLFLAGFGILLLILWKPTYYISLRVASGEARAVNSKDRDFVHAVLDAVNSAIAARG